MYSRSIILWLVGGLGLCAQSVDFKELDQYLDANLAVAAPNGYLLTITQHGQTVYQRAVKGYTADKKIFVASGTKWVSAATLMTLVDDGVLSLDDTVGKYLPEAVGQAAQATLRQLLSHTSGLQDLTPCVGDDTFSLGQCAARIVASPVKFAPGTGFSYGGASINVAGRMAEVATGKTWDTLFAERLVKPLGLTCSSYGGTATVSYPGLTGDLETCSADMGRFLEMILQRGVFRGTRVLSAAAVAAMQADVSGAAPVVDTPYRSFMNTTTELQQWHYGLGEWREAQDALDGLALRVSSQGSLGFTPWVDVEYNVTGVLAMQDTWFRVVPAYAGIKDILHRLLKAAPLRHTGVKNAATHAPTAVVAGGLVELTGSGFGSSAATRVLFDGTAGETVSALDGKVVAVSPAAVAGKTQVSVEIETAGVKTPAVTLPVEAAAPGIFAEVLNENGYVNSTRWPARPGSVIMLYTTGGGGLAARVWMGGVEAVVEGTEAALAGVQEVRVRVPLAVRRGARVPVTVRYGGATSAAIGVVIR